ncbi:hypothetical protein Sango_0361300 [Sesamum angolense]|uniref:RNase H type-1 domain-containing protein n=1 Tax=Sesamum angolense TaxID=2727404 RepID=A0AAE1XAE8_9LAMI|nr:hypothetical protein Sango_0361300 [Sesamum angolense]
MPPVSKPLKSIRSTWWDSPYWSSLPRGISFTYTFQSLLRLLALSSSVRKKETNANLLCQQKLSEYEISYLPRTTIKAQALADFIFVMTGISSGDTPKIEKWLLHVDGSSTIQGNRAGVVITSPHREDLEFAVKFDFKASNNEAEYEALLIGINGSRNRSQAPGNIHGLPISSQTSRRHI